jgi:hypothetical protein
MVHAEQGSIPDPSEGCQYVESRLVLVWLGAPAQGPTDVGSRADSDGTSSAV